MVVSSPSVLVAVALACAALCGGTGAVSTASSKEVAVDPALVEVFKEMANGHDPCSGLTVRYADGNGLDGWTYVDLEDASVRVKRIRPGHADEVFEGTPTPEECRALARQVVEGRLWLVRSTREHGVPDETRPAITVGARGHTHFTVQVWDNETRSIPEFATMRSRILDLARRVSGDRVTY